MDKSPTQQILEANERVADLAHRCDALRRRRDFARWMAGAGWVTAATLGIAMILFMGSSCADESTALHDIGGPASARSQNWRDLEKGNFSTYVIEACSPDCARELHN